MNVEGIYSLSGFAVKGSLTQDATNQVDDIVNRIAAEGGGVLKMDRPVAVQTITIPDTVSLEGVHPARSVIQALEGGEDVLIRQSPSKLNDQSAVRNLTLKGCADKHGIDWADGRMFEVYGNFISGFSDGAGVRFSSNYDQTGHGAYYGMVSRNIIRQNRWGVKFKAGSPANSNSITFNQINANTDGNIFIEPDANPTNILVMANTMECAPGGIAINHLGGGYVTYAFNRMEGGESILQPNEARICAEMIGNTVSGGHGFNITRQRVRNHGNFGDNSVQLTGPMRSMLPSQATLILSAIAGQTAPLLRLDGLDGAQSAILPDGSLSLDEAAMTKLVDEVTARMNAA
jgi:hypothetical protein